MCTGRELSTLTVVEVCQLVSDLAGISADAAARYHKTLRHNNISGWVLCACELPALKRVIRLQELWALCVMEISLSVFEFLNITRLWRLSDESRRILFFVYAMCFNVWTLEI